MDVRWQWRRGLHEFRLSLAIVYKLNEPLDCRSGGVEIGDVGASEQRAQLARLARCEPNGDKRLLGARAVVRAPDCDTSAMSPGLAKVWAKLASTLREGI